jgi:hypothetical protein
VPYAAAGRLIGAAFAGFASTASGLLAGMGAAGKVLASHIIARADTQPPSTMTSTSSGCPRLEKPRIMP